MSTATNAMEKPGPGGANSGAGGRIESPFVRYLRPLASMQLTVWLFALSLLLVWFGTLAQDKIGIWDVVRDYFRSFFVWVDFNIFLPKGWFGSAWEDVRFGFWFVGGKTIGIALFLNLFAAHAVRFKVQTKGTRLWAGLGVIAAGTLITFMVIANGNAKDGIQDKPLFEWRTVWHVLMAGVLLTWIVMIVGWIRIPAERFLERILLMLGLAGVTAMLGWMGYWETTGRRLDDSSLRILWQLMQGTIAGGVTLVGCILAFKKRAGVVLLHGGIGLMMLNELLVAQYAREEQMRVLEGQSIDFARETRFVELSVINRDDPVNDKVVVIPGSRLRAGKMIRDDLLPFNVFVERFDKNSEVKEKPVPTGDALVSNYAEQRITVTQGFGLRYDMTPLRPWAGADANDKTDVASAYVSIWSKDEDDRHPIATLLLSQEAYLNGIEERITVDNKTYFVGLRFKRNYKPYSIQLNDVTRDLYVGTTTPRGYASDFEIIPDDTGDPLPYHISMNNPLRYNGETFYQSGYFQDPRTGQEYSTFQIVTNDGWMIPYVSCMLVIVGMLAHFAVSLMRFVKREDADAPMLFGSVVAFCAAGLTGVRLWKETLERKRRAEQVETDTLQHLKEFETKKPAGKKRTKPSGAAGVDDAQLVDSSEPQGSFWVRHQSNLILAGVLLLGLLVVGRSLSSNKAAKNEIPLDKVGTIPIVADGRALPLDSYARNTLRTLIRREEFVDLKDDKQPAIRWMMDLITGHEDADKYKIFKISNPELQSLLQLDRRKSKTYSYNEINRRRVEFEESCDRAINTEAAERSNYHKALLDLKRKVSVYEALGTIHQLPPSIGDELDIDQGFERLRLTLRVVEDSEQIPLGITTAETNEQGKHGWQALFVGTTRQWLRDLAVYHELETVEALAGFMYQELIPDEEVVLRERLDEQMIEFLALVLKEETPELSVEEAIARARETLPLMPQDMRDNMDQRFEPQIRAEMAAMRGQFREMLSRVLGDEGLDAEPNASVTNWTALLRAYQQEDEEGFAKAVDAQLDYVASTEIKDYHDWRMGFESFYRRFSPLYVATILYVIAGVIAAIAWGVLPKELNRASFWLIAFALAIHTFALIARMAISGRPPVTNLYSSAVFIGWGAVILCLILEIVFRIGIGNVLASVFGFLCLMVAYALSIEEDTFKVVVAVLDTQFWLATHVVCITLGYATTFVAGGLGSAYIVAGLVSKSIDQKMRKMISRMLYGMVCFSIFFSFFGTVLGGLWADDSWGRFWGWDPKENGALLIVIWNALILHARWSGIVRERGIAMLAVFGNVVTTWSWFLVNQLGIGLHSYGFNEGVLTTAGIFCASQMLIIGLGAIPTQYWSSYRNDSSA